MNQNKLIKKWGASVLKAEAETVLRLSERLDDGFVQACHRLSECRGRIVFMGIGKSAHVARKIASTLSSIGSASIFIHLAEAGHGDLGMIRRQDLAVIVSNSGESYEINCVLPALKEMAIPVIGLGSRPQSSLARAADVYLDTHVDKEACPLGLTPTNSSTAALAMGDALAMAISQIKKLDKKGFARTHPHGRLGRQLTMRVDDLMRTGKNVPQVKSGTLLIDTLCEISEKGMGMTLVTDVQSKPIGIFTDGDLRRALEKRADVHGSRVDEVMTSPFHSVRAGEMAIDVLRWMKEKPINSAPVLDERGALIGAISIHVLLQAGL